MLNIQERRDSLTVVGADWVPFVGAFTGLVGCGVLGGGFPFCGGVKEVGEG